MSPALSSIIARVATKSRFRRSKRYRGTSELVDDDDEEEEDEEEEENEEVEESSDSDSESEDAKDEGPTAEDEDPNAGDEGLAAGDEGPGMRVESLGLGWEAVVPEGQQRAAPVVKTSVSKPLGLGYGALRRREIVGKHNKIYIVIT
ncbi:hypothetical protein Tco_0919162 [Tanacetum coccineum]